MSPTRRWRRFIVIAFLLVVGQGTKAQEIKVSGVVIDSSDSVVTRASIEFRTASQRIHATSDSRGEFTVTGAGTKGILVVSSPGFKQVELEISSDSPDSIQIRLLPDTLIARINVRPDYERIPATPAAQFSIPQKQIELAGALTTDEVLRQVPGFSLFRRSGSLSANPTSQGVSLRGVGANGASRSVVLLDGVPLNSPFGGWVYWNRVPRVAIESMETFEGGVSELYGSGALGGVININSRKPEKSFATGEFSFGNQTTPTVSIDAGKSFKDWSTSVAFQALRNDGYVVVAEKQRGRVDTNANLADITGSITLHRNLGHRGTTFLRLNNFAESRHNGTPLQVNNSRIFAIDAGGDLSVKPTTSSLSFRLYGSSEIFNQDFSAVALDRNSESLTNRQHNPSQQIGGALQWRWNFLRRHILVSGVEGRYVRGHSAEDTFAASRLTTHLDAGGRQASGGAFVQDNVELKSWFVTFGLRFDEWRNSRGFLNRLPTVGQATFTTFATKSETALSPRISVSRGLGQGLYVGGSFYRSFRAPTLNELYRSFRVGNVVTGANAELRAERLTGGEIGISLQRFDERLTIRSNLFLSNIDDPVANVTLSSSPALITRQRQNLGSLRATGIELSVNYKLSRHWDISEEYSLTSSKIASYPASATLVGLMIPQVPRNQLNAQLSYSDETWSAGLQGRMVGRQFDDDLNSFSLRSFVAFDAELSRRISRQWNLFVATQNLTGVRYETSKSPVTTIGPPALIRIGARWSYNGK